jgi:ATP-dependent RNA helicase DeaD
MGREDTLKPKRGPKRDFDAPRGKKRRRDDDDAAPHHPAYEPLDMKALANDGDAPRKARKPRDADGDGPRKGKPKASAKPSGAKKKAPKKNKPSRAQRKADRTK